MIRHAAQGASDASWRAEEYGRAMSNAEMSAILDDYDRLLRVVRRQRVDPNRAFTRDQIVDRFRKCGERAVAQLEERGLS